MYRYLINLRSVPGKRAFPVNISAIMQPTDHISTKENKIEKWKQR